MPRNRGGFSGGGRAAAAALVATVAATLAVGAAAVGTDAARSAAAGRLDPRFGGDGIVLTSFGANVSAGVRQLVVQPDGRVIAVGSAADASSSDGDVAAARYLEDGALDPSFGRGGRAVIDVGGRDAAATDAVLQPDGRLVVVGAIDSVARADGQDLLLVRLRTDGTLDRSFGRNGVATADLSAATPDGDFGLAVALQPDGGIVAAGQTVRQGTQTVSLAIVRFRADGRLDPTFGAGGVVAPATPASMRGLAVLVQPGGRILVGGEGGGESRALLVRVLRDGRFDATFGTGGVVSADRGAIRAILPADDGAVVTVGTAPRRTAAAAVVARFDRRGRLDRSFGRNGRVETVVAPATRGDGAYAAASDSSGRIVTAGANGADFFVARLSARGRLDRGFGGTGVVTVDLGARRSDLASAVAVGRDGTVLAAGDSVRPNDVSDFGLARLTGAGRGGTRYASLTAVNVAAGVRLRWQTTVEDGTRAFAVHRSDGRSSSARTLLTRTPIRARARAARYVFLDPDPPSYTPSYWLQERRTDGSRAWFGPIVPSE